jgi:hypothetical protein
MQEVVYLDQQGANMHLIDCLINERPVVDTANQLDLRRPVQQKNLLWYSHIRKYIFYDNISRYQLHMQLELFYG